MRHLDGCRRHVVSTCAVGGVLSKYARKIIASILVLHILFIGAGSAGATWWCCTLVSNTYITQA